MRSLPTTSSTPSILPISEDTNTTLLTHRSTSDNLPSDLIITGWPVASCNGRSVTSSKKPGAIYGQSSTFSVGIKSYHLSRDLLPEEQLDFSTAGKADTSGDPDKLNKAPIGQKEGEMCDAWSRTAEGKKRTAGRCWMIEGVEVKCFRLWKH